ncbi:cell wall-binding repeat-containing protein [Leifsonia poae]|uniref:cell wall-binding repeat-containing protein n=1 Tax=Leifsonia poae TaxID=110933 RepID=UPI003D68F69B
MVSGGNRAGVRAMVTALLSFAVVAGVLTASPAVADDSHRSQYYDAVAKAQGTSAPDDAQLEKNVRDALGDAGVSALAAPVADASQFKAGRLVEDADFYRGDAWPAETIQAFLESKVPTCQATSGPTCLRNYRATTPSKAAGAACSAYTGQANASAAAIIAGVGRACGINPVVLLALIQKEQGLVYSSKPTQWMYDHATGWNCPDVGADPQCDGTPTSTGFFNQVFGAAWQFKTYGSDPYFDWFPVGSTSAIQYNLDKSCGTKNVLIENKATAALYYYTPYTPNQASLNNYPGEGDACSAYGIRNFWMFFHAWWGYGVTRASGSDRFETSAAISRAAIPSPGAGIAAAYVANGMVFPDALAAAPAAAKRGGPLLLTTAGAVPAVIMTELRRLKPTTIYVVGGPQSVSDAAVAQLAGIKSGQVVKRISGWDRFQTSQAIALDAFQTSHPTRAYLAYGLNFPDALSAGAAAGAKGYPVLLVVGGTPDAATIATLRKLGVTQTTVVGGTTVIPDSYLTGLRQRGFTAGRIAGDDRFLTSLAIMKDAFPSSTPTTYVASGMAFPDALSGAALAAKTKNALLVTPGWCVYPGSVQYAQRSSTIGLIGGTTAVSPQVGLLSACQ